MLPLLLWLLAARKKKLQRLRPHQLPHLRLQLLLLLTQLLVLLRLPLALLRLLLVPLRLPPALLLPQTQRRNNFLQRVEKSRRKAAFFVHDFLWLAKTPGVTASSCCVVKSGASSSRHRVSRR